MSSKLVLSVLLACGMSVVVRAAEEPANSTLLKQCESAKGEVKEECREVAKEMLRKDQPADERDDKTSQDVTHSSPAMTSPQETKREARNKKKDTAAPEPAKPDPSK